MRGEMGLQDAEKSAESARAGWRARRKCCIRNSSRLSAQEGHRHASNQPASPAAMPGSREVLPNQGIGGRREWGAGGELSAPMPRTQCSHQDTCARSPGPAIRPTVPEGMGHPVGRAALAGPPGPSCAGTRPTGVSGRDKRTRG